MNSVYPEIRRNFYGGGLKRVFRPALTHFIFAVHCQNFRTIPSKAVLYRLNTNANRRKSPSRICGYSHAHTHIQKHHHGDGALLSPSQKLGMKREHNTRFLNRVTDKCVVACCRGTTVVEIRRYDSVMEMDRHIRTGAREERRTDLRRWPYLWQNLQRQRRVVRQIRREKLARCVRQLVVVSGSLVMSQTKVQELLIELMKQMTPFKGARKWER